MASIVDICNLALSHIGSDAVVSAISPPDGSVEAGHCARIYPIARTELLDAHSWSFARTRVTLAEVDNPSTTWAYAYALPSDCLTPKRVLNSFTLVDYGFLPIFGWVTPSELALINERGSADFDIENGVVLTNEPDAVLLYTRDVIDTAKFTPTFTVALSYLMSAYLAGPLIKGSEGASASGKFRQLVYGPSGRGGGLLSQAAESDANGSSESASMTPDSIRARV